MTLAEFLPKILPIPECAPKIPEIFLHSSCPACRQAATRSIIKGGLGKASEALFITIVDNETNNFLKVREHEQLLNIVI